MYDQINLFEYTLPKFQTDKPIRLIELFAGIGSQAMALRDVGADFEHYRVVEFDRFAVASYNAIHGTDFKTTDIRDLHGTDLGIADRDGYTYLLTYSFPCQDLSVAGKGAGMRKGSGTRSGLLWEVERLLNETNELPHVLLMENVPQVHSRENMPDFQKWISFLESKGYSNYWQDLNAKNYGVAQNRDRCFMVSILGEYSYKFPQPIPLEKTMKDYLEDEVDEKYYINTENARKLIEKLINDYTESVTCVDLSVNEPKPREVANCITAKDRSISNQKCVGNGVLVRQVGNIVDSAGWDNPQIGRVYDANGLSPTINTCQGGNREPKIVAMRGRNPENPSDRTAGINTEQRLEPNSQGICNTLTSVQKDNLLLETKSVYRIRKLTPLECWRLMGFSDEDFRKAEKVNSSSQLYKQAGNSIVKPVLMEIFRKMMR